MLQSYWSMSLALSRTLNENYILSIPAFPSFLMLLFDCKASRLTICLEHYSNPLRNRALS